MKIKLDIEVYKLKELIQTINDFEIDLTILASNKPSVFVSVLNSAELICRFLIDQKLFPKESDKYIYDTMKSSDGIQISLYRYPGILPNYDQEDPSIAYIFPAKRDNNPYFCKVIIKQGQTNLNSDILLINKY